LYDQNLNGDLDDLNSIGFVKFFNFQELHDRNSMEFKFVVRLHFEKYTRKVPGFLAHVPQGNITGHYKNLWEIAAQEALGLFVFEEADLYYAYR